MPLPGYLSTATLTFGPYYDLAGNPAFVGMTGILSLNTPMVDSIGGGTINPSITVTIGAGGTATAGPVVASDDPAVTQGTVYVMRWQALSYKPTPGDKVFQILRSQGTTIDYDTILPVTGSPGTVSLPSVVSVNGKTGVVALGASDVLPTQTGNSGKYLTTDGSAVSWGTVAAGGSTLTPTATKTAAYTAAVGDLAMMNVASGATVLTLPTAPADKSQVGYRAIGASVAVPLTVNRGGSTDTIGTTGATTATVPLADETLIYQYDAPNTRWLAIANVKTKASLDTTYALPSQTGNAGKVLTTSGTAPSWTTATGVNPNDVGYDLVLLLGQSNMSGRGTPVDATHYDVSTERIWQYGGSGTFANVVSLAIEPLAMRDTPSGIGPGLHFARWYASSAPSNRKVLLVPQAQGGTQLSTPSTSGWRRGVAGGLYSQALAQAQAALTAAGTNARIVAALWLQGETDGDNNITGTAYQTDLDALIAGLRTDLSLPNLPFVIGEMVPDFLPSGSRAAIDGVHRDTPNRLAHTATVLGVLGQNLGDGNHYNAVAQRILGRRYFDGYLTAVAGTSTAPALQPPLPMTISATGGANQVVIALASGGNGAFSYALYRNTTPTGSPIATTFPFTDTGLTGGTSYSYVATATNPGGTVTSNVATATPSGGGGGVTLTPAPARIYSLRLFGTYAGAAINVRRSSDNTTQDIGFTGGALDTTSLLAFAGAGDAFVVTWYDQSGNAKNLTQATTANQPKIVSAGSMITSGGKPAVIFDGTASVLTGTAPNLFAAGATSTCAVLSQPAASTGRWWSESTAASASAIYALNVSVGTTGKATNLLGTTSVVVNGTANVFTGAIHQLSAVDSGTVVSTYLDAATDVSAVSYTRGVATPDRFSLGGVIRAGGAQNANETLSEALFWTSALSDTNRQAAEANQKAFYGTP